MGGGCLTSNSVSLYTGTTATSVGSMPPKLDESPMRALSNLSALCVASERAPLVWRLWSFCCVCRLG